MESFAAQVKRWAEKAEERIEKVVIASTQEVVEEMLLPDFKGGNMPVDKGHLRGSAIASTDQMPVTRSAAEGPVSDPTTQINLVISNAGAGGTVYIGITAAHARRQNYGFTGTDSLGRQYNQQGRHFVGLAAQNWQTIVSRNVAKADRL